MNIYAFKIFRIFILMFMLMVGHQLFVPKAFSLEKGKKGINSVPYAIRQSFFKEKGIAWSNASEQERNDFMNAWLQKDAEYRSKLRENISVRREAASNKAQSVSDAKRMAAERKQRMEERKRARLESDREKKQRDNDLIQKQRERMADLKQKFHSKR